MPTLAERRAQIAAQGSGGNSGEYLRFKAEGETHILRFLFNDASGIESHRKFWDETEKKWIIDGDRGSYKITFNCVEYDKGGANPRRVRWEVSEYLYNEYLSPYIERTAPASAKVWEVVVRRPGTMDISYNAYPVEGATELTYPIPSAPATHSDTTTAAAPAAPTYTAPAQPTPAPAAAPVVQPAAPAATTPAPTPATAPTTGTVKKSKYF